MIQSSVLYLQRLKAGIRLRYSRKRLVILVGTALWASLVSTPGCVEALGAQTFVLCTALYCPPTPSAVTALRATGSCSGRRTLLLPVTERLPPTPTPSQAPCTFTPCRCSRGGAIITASLNPVLWDPSLLPPASLQLPSKLEDSSSAQLLV